MATKGDRKSPATTLVAHYLAYSPANHFPNQPRRALASGHAGGELLGDPGQPFIVGADARGERARGGL